MSTLDSAQRFTGCSCNHRFDYRPIKILVYKNGDERDKGQMIHVTRRHFRHWLVFLDHLTKVLKTTTAVNKLYTIDGRRITHFEDLRTNGEFVAVERGPFIACDYGAMAEKMRNKEARFTVPGYSGTTDREHFLNDSDGVDIYLKHHGYGSCTGLPYPQDGLDRSPSHSFLMTNRGDHEEKLNQNGREASWIRNIYRDKSLKDRPPSRIPISNRFTQSHPDLRINLSGLNGDLGRKEGSEISIQEKQRESIQAPVIKTASNQPSKDDQNQVLIQISIPQNNNSNNNNNNNNTKESLTVPPIEQERPESRSAGTQTEDEENGKIEENPEKPPEKIENPFESSFAKANQNGVPLLQQRPKLNRPKFSEYETEKGFTDLENESPIEENEEENASKKRSRSQPDRRKKRATWLTEEFDDLDVGVLRLPPISTKSQNTPPTAQIMAINGQEEPKFREFRENKMELREAETVIRSKIPPLRKPLRKSGSYDPDFDNV